MNFLGRFVLQIIEVILFKAWGKRLTATLTFYGAVGMIGGNKILLKTMVGALLLDW